VSSLSLIRKIINRLLLSNRTPLERDLYLNGDLSFSLFRRDYWVSEIDSFLRKHSSDVSVYNQIFIQEEYKRTLEILEEKGLIEGNAPVIFDVGANIGLSTLYFSRKINNAQVIAFEPFPENFERIPEQFQSYPYALWATNTNLKIDRNFRDGKEWSVRVVENTKGSVEGRTLLTIFNELNIKKVDLLKVDIEGSEFEVFLKDKEMQENLKRVNSIVIEIHDESGSREDLENFFLSSNFMHKSLGELDLFYKE